MTKSKKYTPLQIAKDALKHLKGNLFIVDRIGEYLNIKCNNENPNKSLQKALKQDHDCNVCALGACLATVAFKENKLDVEWAIRYNYKFYSFYQETVYETLTKHFNVTQLILIECAFEMRKIIANVGNYTPENYDLIDKAVRFGSRYKRASTRFRKIMENIIKNNGEFKP